MTKLLRRDGDVVLSSKTLHTLENLQLILLRESEPDGDDDDDSVSFSQTCPLLPLGSAPPAVRRCSSGVCRRTPLRRSSGRCSTSAERLPPFARARRTSATSASARSSWWTRPSTCQVRPLPRSPAVAVAVATDDRCLGDTLSSGGRKLLLITPHADGDELCAPRW